METMIDVTKMCDKAIARVANCHGFATLGDKDQQSLILLVLSDGKKRKESEIEHDIQLLMIDMSLEYLVRKKMIKRLGKYEWKGNNVKYMQNKNGGKKNGK